MSTDARAALNELVAALVRHADVAAGHAATQWAADPAGSLLLADCAQSAGKLPLPDADFIALSAHKLGGPPGVGALLVKELSMLEPVGGQEKGYRRGTQDVPGAMAFAAAVAARPATRCATKAPSATGCGMPSSTSPRARISTEAGQSAHGW